ncbi:hypothetical protein D3C71_1789200 [compost metagenome]
MPGDCFSLTTRCLNLCQQLLAVGDQLDRLTLQLLLFAFGVLNRECHFLNQARFFIGRQVLGQQHILETSDLAKDLFRFT